MIARVQETCDHANSRQRYVDTHTSTLYRSDTPLTHDEWLDELDAIYHGGIRRPSFPYTYEVSLASADGGAEASGTSLYARVDTTECYLD